MDTWALQAAAHASLTSGFSPSRLPLGGSAPLGGFALGVMVASLAFVTFNSSLKLRSPWRPADAWQHTFRRARAHQRARLTAPRRTTAAATASAEGSTASAGTPSESSRPYSDLAEPADVAPLERIRSGTDQRKAAAGPRKREQVDEDFWGPSGRQASGPSARQAPGSRKAGSYRSRHRLPESAAAQENGEPKDPGERDELEQPQSHRRPAPRHAAS
jgi:hypothetical protein